jgi:predicted PurR-regulated permease PerM
VWATDAASPIGRTLGAGIAALLLAGSVLGAPATPPTVTDAEIVRGQVMVIVVMSLFYSGALWLAGLDYALAVGMISGILVFVPYLGVVVGVLLGTLAGWAQFGELAGLLPVWGVFVAGQLLEGMAVTPWLVGERVGLHPVAVIFALMAFGQLFGFVGLLVAIPAAAAALVALRHLKTQLD